MTDFSNKNKSEKYLRSSYYKQTQYYLAKIQKLLGDKCQRCDSKKYLQLYHIIIKDDSYTGKDNESGWTTLKRKREAVNHPERFERLCLSCHNSIEPKKRNYKKMRVR